MIPRQSPCFSWFPDSVSRLFLGNPVSRLFGALGKRGFAESGSQTELGNQLPDQFPDRKRAASCFRVWIVLRLAPALSVLLLGCHSLKLSPPVLEKPEKVERDPTTIAPSKYQVRVSQYLFCADFELRRDLPLFQELADLRDQVHKELQLPTASTIIRVHLFEDRQRYEQFMRARYPDLPKRRAFFVAQPQSAGGAEDLLVYTFWGDRIRQDLRHELTHALLHSVLKDVPLWLDEGLAEYFEVPPDAQGINLHHLEQIQLTAGGPLKPDLAHLEELSQVQQMSPVEYREAWAWVHLMLRDRAEAKTELIQYLQQLRMNPNPGPLQPRLAQVFPDLDEALSQHLAKLDSKRTSIYPLPR